MSHPPVHTRCRQHCHHVQNQSSSRMLQPKSFNWSSHPLKKRQISLVLLHLWLELSGQCLRRTKMNSWLPDFAQAFLGRAGGGCSILMATGRCERLKWRRALKGVRKPWGDIQKSVKIWFKFLNCTLLEAGRACSWGGCPCS